MGRGQSATPRSHSSGRRGALACALVVLLILLAAPSAAYAAGSILFWSNKTAPPDTFVSGYGGTWGGNLFCFGGVRTASGTQSAITDVYLYNPAGQAGGTWYTFPSSTPPSVDPAYATTGGGFAQFGSKVYVFGGRPATNLPISTNIWSYDLSTGLTAFEGALATPRNGCGVAIVGSNAYVVGGTNSGGYLNSIEVVDLLATPGTMTGVTMPLTLSNSVTRPIVFADATSVYIFGGLISSMPAPFGTCSNQALRFDPGSTPPSTAGWLASPTPMPYGRQGHHQKAMSGGSVFITGDAINNDVMEYDMALDQWSLVGSQPVAIGRSLNILNASGTEVFEINGYDKQTGTLHQVLQAGQIVPASAVGAPVPIPGAGTPVTASAGGTSITAQFDNVTNPGSALLNVSVLPVGSVPSGAGIGFRIQGQVYDIATTADGYGNVIITLPYTGSRVPVVRHWTGSAWAPITFEWPTSLYPTSPYAIDPWTPSGGGYPAHVPGNGKILGYGSGTVTFQTPSLSPFAVEEAPEEESTPASSTWSLLLAGIAVAVVGGAIGFSKKRFAG